MCVPVRDHGFDGLPVALTDELRRPGQRCVHAEVDLCRLRGARRGCRCEDEAEKRCTGCHDDADLAPAHEGLPSGSMRQRRLKVDEFKGTCN